MSPHVTEAEKVVLNVHLRENAPIRVRQNFHWSGAIDEGENKIREKRDSRSNCARGNGNL